MTPVQILQLASEEESRIVQRVFLAGDDGKRTVIFTAADRGSGCTWLIARVAQRLAALVSGRVCVVDANLRWPAIHGMFRLDNDRGLLQTFAQRDPIRNFIQQVDDTGLWVLTSGGSVADSHGVLMSPKVRERFNELAQQFDFILVDTPAMKASADSGLIGRLADGAVLVIAANTTKRDAAENTKTILEAASVPILGAVLNKRTYPVPDALYRRL